MSNFQNDGVDLAIRYGQVPSNAGLNTELLIQDSFMVVASPDLVKLEQSSLSLNELFEYPLLHDAHHLWSIFLEKLSSEISLNTLKSIRFNQTALAIDAAIAAQGMVLTNPLFIDAELKNGKLIKIYEQELEMDTGFYLVSPRFSKNSENVLKVRNWLVSQFHSS